MDLVDLMKSMSVEDNDSPTVETNFRMFAADICGYHTDFVLGDFVNKHLIIATQYGRLGSLLKITVDQAGAGLNISEPVYNIVVAFGTADIEREAAGRYIAQALNIQKPLFLFLCLKNYEAETVKSVAEAIKHPPENDNIGEI